MSNSSVSSPRKFIFYYDIVCPYSYLASERILPIAERTSAILIWKPVLLGGVYKLTNAPQGKDGSASSVMSTRKQAIIQRDLLMQMSRFDVPFVPNELHPIKTIKAQRLLISVSDSVRPALSRVLYRAYWLYNRNLDDTKVLQTLCKEHFSFEISEYDLDNPSENVKKQLIENTEELVKRGGFGIPSFWVEKNDMKRLFFGSDRMHLLEKALSNENVIVSLPQARRRNGLNNDFVSREGSIPRRLVFFYDFSSPYSYLAASQIERIVYGCHARLEWVPFLLGALFRQIGTVDVPLSRECQSKRNYAFQDLKDWSQWWGVEFNWPSCFPMRTLLPLRIAIVEPSVIHCIFTAAWVSGEDIGSWPVLSRVLQRAGFDANHLFERASQPQIKQQLHRNTERALKANICGAPSFQVFASGLEEENEGTIIWGQDRLDVVQDLLCGWRPPKDSLKSRL